MCRDGKARCNGIQEIADQIAVRMLPSPQVERDRRKHERSSDKQAVPFPAQRHGGKR